MAKRSEVENTELVNLVGKCYAEAHDAFREQTAIESPFPGDRGRLIDNPYPIYDEFYRQKHWARMGRMPSWKSTPKDTRPFQVVENNTTLLTDNRPKVSFLPVEVDDKKLADKVQAGWQHWCNQTAYDVNLTLAVKDSRKFGIGWVKLCYDADAKTQRLEVVPPESVKVDPDTTCDQILAGREPNYLLYEYIAMLGDLKAQFPNPGFDWDTDFQHAWTPQPGSLSLMDRVRKFMPYGNSTVKNPAVSVPVYELWIRDDERIIFEEEIGEAVVVKSKKKYKGGRRIIAAGGQILYDGKNPYDHGQLPFTPIFAYPESGKFYTAGDIENVITPVVMLNRMQQLLFDSTVKAGGGILFVNRRFGASADMFTNEPMQVVEVADVNQAARFDRWPAPSRHIFEYMDTLYRVIDDAAGMHDISRGTRSPGNPMTAQEVAVLSESDRTRIRLAARILGWANERIARQWVSNQAQWGGWEWFVRVAGEDGEDMTVEFTPDDLKKPKYDKDGNQDGYSDEMLEFDVVALDSSSLPAAYQERRQMAMELFGMGLIDPQAVLETLDFPGWRAVMERMKAEAAAQPPAEPPADGGIPPEGAPAGEHMMPDGTMMPDAAMQGAPMGGGMDQMAQMMGQMGPMMGAGMGGGEMPQPMPALDPAVLMEMIATGQIDEAQFMQMVESGEIDPAMLAELGGDPNAVF